MAFSLMNGVSEMGKGIAQYAGTAGLEMQKADMQQQALRLADQLATTREQDVTQPFAERMATQTQAAETARSAATNTAAGERNAATIASEERRQKATLNAPTPEMKNADYRVNGTPEQREAQEALMPGRSRFQYLPTTKPDPSDPTKTISGILKLDTHGVAPAEFIQTDTDPNKGSGGLGNRAEVQQNRVVAAGNAAAKAVENIMELPATVSTGWFAGAGQGTGILAATKHVLTNAVTSQDVQSFKVMATGVGRNMATLETQGLAPPQGFTHSMETTMLAEGDTQETKLRKMAEMRQIIEANLEPSLSNDRVSVSQKNLVKDIIKKVQTAIPFTQHDITVLSQSKNPTATMADMMKEKGLGGGASSGTDQTSTFDGSAAPSHPPLPSGFRLLQ